MYRRALHAKIEVDTVTDAAGTVSLTGGVKLFIDQGREFNGEQWIGPVTMLDLMNATQAGMMSIYADKLLIAAGV